jgi:hypothetical protein
MVPESGAAETIHVAIREPYAIGVHLPIQYASDAIDAYLQARPLSRRRLDIPVLL